MSRSKRLKVLLSIFFVTLVSSLTWAYTQRYKEVSVEEYEEVLGVQVSTGIPYITSLPPIVAYEGELYEYYVRGVDSDTDLQDLSLGYIEGPEWLYLEGFVLRGFVPEGSRGTYKIVLRVSDGYNSSTQEEYILVEEIVENVE
jgi:hypothetical protein